MRRCCPDFRANTIDGHTVMILKVLVLLLRRFIINFDKCNQNIRSISANLSALLALIARTKVKQDVIVPTEYW